MTVTTGRLLSRNLVLLLAANAVLLAAMPMLIILGGLAGLKLAPSPNFATLPPSVQMLAGLLAAGPMSIFMGKYGRQKGFILGALLAIVGGGLGYVALSGGSFVILCLAHMSLGAALVCFNYFRFAASEVVDEPWRPVAISLVLGSGLIAAFAGPEIFNRTKDLLLPIQFAGAYLALCVTSTLGIAILLFLNIRATPHKATTASVAHIPLLTVLSRPTVATAILAGVVSQGVMVFMMTPTPLAMHGFGFSESSASDVIRWHVVAMFAPSFVTGFLIKRFGAPRIVYVGLALLCCSAAFALAGMQLHHFHGALILLGIGWNFGFIGSTSILASASTDDDKARLQGVNDTMVALSAVVCSFASGWLVTSVGWSAIAWTIFPVLAFAVAMLIWLHGQRAARLEA